MHPARVLGAVALALVTLGIGLPGCLAPAPGRERMPPIVAGLTRPGLEARLRGRVLLEELGCVACHADASGELVARAGPELAGVGRRIHADYVPRFLADPAGVEPGTTMPDLLGALAPEERAESAEALAEYLGSFAEPALAAEESARATPARGHELFHSIGCVACHAPRSEDGVELPLPGSAPLGELSAKYPLAGLRTFLLDPLEARPAGRMPDLGLEPGEAQDLAAFLLGGKPTAPRASTPGDPVKIVAGRALFAELGCAQCHQVPDPLRAPSRGSKPLAELDPERGCLSGATGGWPLYSLAPEQRADLQAALQSLDEPLSDEQRIRTGLAAQNCIACHARDDFGGITPERNEFFSGDPSLGQDGRLPPPLGGVGAKLQPAWLEDSIAHGQAVRPYLRTRMPGFGLAVARSLAAPLARTDTLPPLEFGLAAMPDDHEAREPILELGRTLTGDRGLGCVSCHAFAGERGTTMNGIDLVDSTGQRLRREWFEHFLRAPFRLRADTLMPQFFEGERSSRPELGDGSTQQQIDALWLYLAEGRNVRQPSGLWHPPMPLAVANEAVMLRRSLQGTGKRAISVGLPLGVNLSFDAESLALDQLWWGKFLDAAQVWTGQGSGEARILGDARVNLSKGLAFAVLAEANAPWPTESRRVLGQRFLGYELDAEQRPTFRYTCADVTIADAPRELAVEGASRPTLRRTLTFASTSEGTLTFRAARAAGVTELAPDLVAVGPSLRLRLPPGSFRIRAVGEEQELLVEIPIRGGAAELTLDYTWEESR